LSPEEELQVLPSLIAATKRTEETSTELEREKLQKLRKDLEERLAALSETGTLYEKLRSDMPSGSARTSELEKVMAQARTIAKDTDANAEEARELFDRGSQGNRIAAIALAQERHNPEFFPLVIEAIRHPATPFEHYHALRAAYSMLPKLNDVQRQELGNVVKDQRSGRVYYSSMNRLRRYPYSIYRLARPDEDIQNYYDRILHAIGVE
jgi:chromosome segregation ATPase